MDKKQHELLARRYGVSVCVPASKVHPALVVPIWHALRVHRLCEQTSPTWTTHKTSEQRFEHLGSLLTQLSDWQQWSTTTQWECNFHSPAHSIPEIACIICLVIISRSSSDRCARLSIRAEWAWGAASCLRAEPLAACLLARSLCSLLVSVAAPAAEDSGEEAAAHRSSATSSANSTRTFPDMSAYGEKDRVLANFLNHPKSFKWQSYFTCEDEMCSQQELMSSDASGADLLVSELTHPFIPKVWYLSDVALKSKTDNSVHWLTGRRMQREDVRTGNDGPLHPRTHYYAFRSPGKAFFALQ